MLDLLGLPPEMVTPPPGPRSRQLASRLTDVESPAFDARRRTRETVGGDQSPIVYTRGNGCNVFDADGNRYVDLTAGFGSLILGYGPNAAIEAATSALGDLPVALGDVYASELKVRLCEALASTFPEPGARVMLGLSGADAVTAAMKSATLATGRNVFVAFEGAYHGLSHGPLAACGLAPGFRSPFASQLASVRFAPYPRSLSDLEPAIRCVSDALAPGDVAGVIVEPILGRGGCVVPPASFLPSLRALCSEQGSLLIVDEIWTGLGRSGRWLASEGVVPDLLCLGKALGAGLPVSACVGRARVMQSWAEHGGSTLHTSTHVGHPPGCAAALAVLSMREDLLLQVRETGTLLMEALARCEGPLVPHVREVHDVHVRVRGQGLMIGVDLGSPQAALHVARRLLSRGIIVLTGGIDGATLTLSPAFTLAPALIPYVAHEFAQAIRQEGAACVAATPSSR